MSETEQKIAPNTPQSNPNTLTAMPTSALQVVTRMLRSPSHESVTTDLSLFSVSSIASDAKCVNRFKSYSDVQLSVRGPSPNPDARQIHINRPPDIPEMIWFEEENELIRSCAALSSALGLQKSFSTSDVSQLTSPESADPRVLRSAVSAIALDAANRTGFLFEQARLERSCSTWVAVGDVCSTSQLPSPHGGAILQPPSNALSLRPPQIPFTAADLVRSVNKKVRQNYIRRRLLTTYRALERLSQSEFNLDRLEAAATAAQAHLGPTLIVPGTTLNTSTSFAGRKEKEHVLTVKDVERERGKQLSKYERNMMIFNWLHTIDPTVEEVGAINDILTAHTADSTASVKLSV